MRIPRTITKPCPDAVRAEKQLRAMAAARRKGAPVAGAATFVRIVPAPASDTEGRARRGPAPDPDREHTAVGLSVRLTKREAKELERRRREIGADLTDSTFLRYIVCDFLERHRRKDCPTRPFTLDLAALDWRSRLASER